MFKYCQGDDPEAEAYHADVTLQYGIRFAWVGAMTRMTGQGVVPSMTTLATVLDMHSPFRTGLNVLKEVRKRVLGKLADPRFLLHSSNQLTRPYRLRDGQSVHEFCRYCHHPNGVPYGGSAQGLPYLISASHLDQLKAQQGYMIVYTHFGQHGDSQHLISQDTRRALSHLEQEYRSEQIYVTTTAKLLNYYQRWNDLSWSAQETDGQIWIDIGSIDDPIFGKSIPTVEELQGITFYIPNDREVRIRIDGKEVARGLRRNRPDYMGRESVMFPLIPLVFPY